MAVYLPAGTYVVRKRILISSSYVVLRGLDVSREGACRGVGPSRGLFRALFVVAVLCEAVQSGDGLRFPEATV